MDQPTGDDAKTIFDAIVLDSELRKAVRAYSDTYPGNGRIADATQKQIADGVAVIRKARELRRLLRS
jgi:hypothetical protein